MKYCPYCGVTVEGMKYCPDCGKKLESDYTGNSVIKHGFLYLTRDQSAVAVAVKTRIFIDGIEYDKLGSGDGNTYELEEGKHKLSIKQPGGGTAETDINISETRPVSLGFIIKMSGPSIYEKGRNVATKQKKEKNTSGIIAVLLIIAFFLIVRYFTLQNRAKNSTEIGTQVQDNVEKDAETRKLELGETTTVNGLQITVIDYYYCDDMPHITPAGEGERYCVVNVTVKNVHEKAVRTDDFTSSLIYDDKYTYLSKFAISPEFFYANDSMQPLTEMNACFCFAIAPEVETNTDSSLVFKLAENTIYRDNSSEWILR